MGSLIQEQKWNQEIKSNAAETGPYLVFIVGVEQLGPNCALKAALLPFPSPYTACNCFLTSPTLAPSSAHFRLSTVLEWALLFLSPVRSVVTRGIVAKLKLEFFNLTLYFEKYLNTTLQIKKLKDAETLEERILGFIFPVELVNLSKW